MTRATCPAPSRAWLLAASLALLGCDPSAAAEAHPCPPEGTSLRYATFGRPFFDAHCQSCHGAPVGHRQGASPAHDFGTHDSIRRSLERIYLNAADGNTAMPPGPDDPSAEERARLGEWLGCGAP